MLQETGAPVKTIGKYEIRGLLGKGGMSVVYKARLPEVHRLVALKLLSPHPHLLQLLGEREIERRFMAEARTMARFRHPHIVDLLDFDRDGERPFFTMEYYCQSLGLIMGEGPRTESPSRILKLDRIIHYARQMLLGLSRLHRSGVVHRDIKPYNLLVTDADQLKICDFGFSRLRGERLRGYGGLIVGSPYYAAPEQERDPESVDARADVYSAGVVIYRMLTGLLPGDEGPRPSETHPEADPAWDSFVAKALSHQRENRFPSAQAMLEEIDALEARWNAEKRDRCSGFPGVTRGPAHTPLIEYPIRSKPAKVSPGEAQQIFQCDSLGRPQVHAQHDFVLLPGPDLVLDRMTHLLWQRSGSPDPLEWPEARVYLDSLNARRHGGCSNWRLPTVQELFTLLNPFSFGGADCLDAPFDKGKNWLWSADRRSFFAAWYVDAELGFAGWSDFTCRYHVRAVCMLDAGMQVEDPSRLLNESR